MVHNLAQIEMRFFDPSLHGVLNHAGAIHDQVEP